MIEQIEFNKFNHILTYKDADSKEDKEDLT